SDFLLVFTGYRVWPQVGNAATSVAVRCVEDLLANRMVIRRVQLAKIAADQSHIVSVSNETLRVTINDEGIEVVPEKRCIQLIDSLERLLRSFIDSIGNIAQQCFRFFDA